MKSFLKDSIPLALRTLILITISVFAVIGILKVTVLSDSSDAGLVVQDYFNYSIVTQAYHQNRITSPWDLSGLRESITAEFGKEPQRPMLISLGPIGLILIDSSRQIVGSLGLESYRVWMGASFIYFFFSILLLVCNYRNLSSSAAILLIFLGTSEASLTSIALGQTTLLGLGAALMLLPRRQISSKHQYIDDFLNSSALLIASMKPVYFVPAFCLMVSRRQIRPLVLSALIFTGAVILHSGGEPLPYISSYLLSLGSYVQHSPSTQESAPIAMHTLPGILFLLGIPLSNANLFATWLTILLAFISFIFALCGGPRYAALSVTLSIMAFTTTTPYVGTYDLLMSITPLFALWYRHPPKTNLEFFAFSLISLLIINSSVFGFTGPLLFALGLFLLVSIVWKEMRLMKPASQEN